jgi:predicted ribonuclease toxin of YeeF-YezG toxin-antitoxin module
MSDVDEGKNVSKSTKTMGGAQVLVGTLGSLIRSRFVVAAAVAAAATAGAGAGEFNTTPLAADTVGANRMSVEVRKAL